MRLSRKLNQKTSYFPGTGKRHGLAVVSGMALRVFKGETLKAVVLIFISLHRNTFTFNSHLAGMKQPRCHCCFMSRTTDSRCHRFGVRKHNSQKTHYDGCFTDILPPNLHPANNPNLTFPTHSRGTKTSQRNGNGYQSFK